MDAWPTCREVVRSGLWPNGELRCDLPRHHAHDGERHHHDPASGAEWWFDITQHRTMLVAEGPSEPA